ncbi:hypothetical protein FA95DRAFT_1611893 [Auriscalpium vulgare]|uniref:Uncharacterized protein n=1 Tax=Auriscalpium vulgare TaxID=40419 RepID=A0ACB8R805_9AGAM|nr:hypothetical protein FA95DRAFT_1611893 [Auriscalpium vulgare]
MNDLLDLIPERSVLLDRYLDGIYTPALGAYVVFTLDAVATLETLRDPVATAEARALQSRQYIGLMIESMDVALPGVKYEECCISLLSTGLPLPAPSEALDEDMCVAVAPATHPKGRPSVSPSPSLPWEHLYHHTTIIETVRLPSRPGNYSACPLLSLSDVDLMEIAFNNDGLRSDDMERDFKEQHDPQEQNRLTGEKSTPLEDEWKRRPRTHWKRRSGMLHTYP